MRLCFCTLVYHQAHSYLRLREPEKREMEGENSSNDVYRECLRNHAASLGSYATDGCGEFTLDDTSSPGGLQCAACGCHRNFHRRVTYAPGVGRSSGGGTAHHRVISCSSRGDLHHEMMTSQELIDYNVGGGGGAAARQMMVVESPDSGDRSGSGRKRFRSKFTVEQKEKMLAFAEKLGWKLQRKDLEDEIERFCRSIGVSRQVFKVWMHNHKNLSSSSSASTTANASSLTTQ
ncbi:putative transcription factor ZF-HD family [Rosa chinensis]|uniref:Putative transcription factor ZF-HD family n=1 Tax=Rosa chinensis TaxID=74649 RepID=A0A2P6P1P4_ROSCH|nr:zinc-finger homeodomain protein 10 [Rosa chinensis]PRQ15836.1 putative transcription factor ZF-HD family [Rosa chinensis]